MNACSKGQKLERRKRRIKNRLRERRWKAQKKPMLRAANIQSDVALRDRGLAVGGIGAMFQLARHTGLVEAIDEDLHLPKVHLPDHESDHVLNIALNVRTGGTLPGGPRAPSQRRGISRCARCPTHPGPNHGGGLLPAG